MIKKSFQTVFFIAFLFGIINLTYAETDDTSPSNITDLSVTDTTENSVTLSWTAPGDDGDTGTATTYDIRYSTSTITETNWSSATEVSGEPSPQTAGSTESFEVTGLSADTIYYFAIKTKDEADNESGLSNIVSDKTTDINPPAKTSDLSVTNTTGNSITLSWTAPGDNADVGRAAKYDIRYSQKSVGDVGSEADWWNQAIVVANIPSPKAAGSTESFVISGLDSDTTYYFAIKTADEADNWSELSNIADGDTKDVIPPANITDLTVSTKTENSITLQWTAPGDDGGEGQATTYDIRYSTSTITETNWSSATQVSDEPSPETAGETEGPFVISGLIPNTIYYFAIKTKDEADNWSGLSNIVYSTTEDITPPAKIEDLRTTNPTKDSITLSWTAPGDDGDTGTATTYDIRYSTSTITATNWDSATEVSGEPSPERVGNSESFVVSELDSNTTYYFAIKTKDEVGNESGLSNIASAETKDGIAPTEIADLGATSLTESSITLSWTSPGDDDNTGTATEYDIRYSMTEITDGASPEEKADWWRQSLVATNVPSPKPAGTSQSFVISGLTPDRYYFAIKTGDEVDNWSDLSNIANATTKDVTPPSKITNLGATSTAENSITLSWTVPDDDRGVTEYDIRYSKTAITDASSESEKTDWWASATSATNIPSPQAAGTPQSFVVSGLIPGTDYYFAIKTADEAGNLSELSNIATDTTIADTTAPAAINNLYATNPTENSVTLSWTAPGDDGNTGTAKTYDIRYSTSTITETNWNSATQVAGEPSPQATGTSQSRVVYGLNSGTTYYFAIKTVDDAENSSELSNIVTVTTSTSLKIKDDSESPGTLSEDTGEKRGHIGTAVELSGKGYEPGEVVEVEFVDEVRGTREVVSTPSADENGAFTASFLVGLQPGGRKIISVTGSRRTQSAEFKIEPKLTRFPSETYIGDTVTVRGSGFGADSELTVAFGNTKKSLLPVSLTDGTTSNSDGEAEFRFVIPNIAYTEDTDQNGKADTSIRVTDSQGLTTGPVDFLEITPQKGTITVTPAEVTSGEYTIVTGLAVSPLGIPRADENIGEAALSTPDNLKLIPYHDIITDSDGNFQVSISLYTDEGVPIRAGTATIEIAGMKAEFEIIPKLEISSPLVGSIQPGGSIEVAGAGYRADEKVSFKLVDSLGRETQIGTTQADTQGKYEVTLDIPQDFAGTYSLRAESAQSTAASVEITIETEGEEPPVVFGGLTVRDNSTGTLSLEEEGTPGGYIGNIVEVSGEGYEPGEVVEVKLADELVDNPSAGKDGKFKSLFVIGVQPGGEKIISVSGKEKIQHEKFMIEPNLTRFPSEAFIDDTVTVRGNGFSPNSQLQVWFGNINLLPLSLTGGTATNSNGEAEFSFKIPQNRPYIEDADNNGKADTSIRVTDSQGLTTGPVDFLEIAHQDGTLSVTPEIVPYDGTVSVSGFAVSELGIPLFSESLGQGKLVTSTNREITLDEIISDSEGEFEFSLSLTDLIGAPIESGKTTLKVANMEAFFTIVPKLAIIGLTNVQPGDYINIEGSGYQAGEDVSFTLIDSLENETQIGTVQADNQGEISTSLNIPEEGVVGKSRLVARGAQSPEIESEVNLLGKITQVKLDDKIYEIPLIEPIEITEQSPGLHKITVYGLNLLPDTQLSVQLGNIQIQNITDKTFDDGAFQTSFTLPFLPNGTKTLRVSTGEEPSLAWAEAHNLINLKPVALMEPLKGSIGTKILVRGTGLNASAQTTVRFGMETGFGSTLTKSTLTKEDGRLEFEFIMDKEFDEGMIPVEISVSGMESFSFDFEYKDEQGPVIEKVTESHTGYGILKPGDSINIQVTQRDAFDIAKSGAYKIGDNIAGELTNRPTGSKTWKAEFLVAEGDIAIDSPVTVMLVDKYGNESKAETDTVFMIGAAARIISISPVPSGRVVGSGETITLTTSVEGKVEEVTFSIEGIENAANIKMKPSLTVSGIYQGTYTVRPEDKVEDAVVTVTLKDIYGNKITEESRAKVSVDGKSNLIQFRMTLNPGINLIHIPVQMFTKVSKLYEYLSPDVQMIISFDQETEAFQAYADYSVPDSPPDAELSGDTGLLVMMKPHSPPREVTFKGPPYSDTTIKIPLGKSGSGGMGMIGLPVNSPDIKSLADIKELDEDIQTVIALDAAQKFTSATAEPDLPPAGGQGFIVITSGEVELELQGVPWEKKESAASPAVYSQTHQDSTKILVINGSVICENVEKLPDRLTISVKNLSTKKTLKSSLNYEPGLNSYQIVWVDFMNSVAQVRDEFQISVHDASGRYRARPIKHEVTAYEISSSSIALPVLSVTEIPSRTVLLPNYPNPFNPETWIPYRLADSAEVTISIYDITGKLVRKFELGKKLAGIYQDKRHAVYWNGRNREGEKVASGIYFYALQAGDFTAFRRMIMLK